MTAYEAAVQEKDQLYARIQLVREEIKQEQDPGRRGEQKGRLRILFEMYHESLDRLDALRPPQEKRHKAVKRTVIHTGAAGADVNSFDFFERCGVTFADLEGNQVRWDDLGSDNGESRARLMRALRRGRAAVSDRQREMLDLLLQGKTATEIAEQLDWKMPDYLAISVGDGCTIAGVWKGLKDLYAIGFIDKLPRLISAQAEGCHPINRAIAENKPWEPMEENTLADSIAVGVPRNADKALMAIRESNGIVVNVTDEEIMAAQKLLGTTCGVFGEPAGVTGTAAVKKLCEQGVLGENDTVVSVVTGNGLKDVANAIKFCGEPMSLPNDLDLLVEEFDKRGIKTEA